MSLIPAVIRHNERIGTRLQHFFQILLLQYLVGPIVWIGLKILFRVEVIGAEKVLAFKPKGILAVRHFFEWDPLVNFYSSVWRFSFGRHQFLAASLASPFWTRSWLRRAFAWLLGVMSFVPEHEPDKGALDRAARLLESDAKLAIAIYPTGPVGRKKNYEIRYGVGYLATRCPDVPVLPITVMGLQDIKLREVLGFRRPRIRLLFGEVFYGREFADGSLIEKQNAVCQRIGAQWRGMEEGH
jgi:1-acyl-sn-glycerol-3-phosphate acyltransferase